MTTTENIEVTFGAILVMGVLVLVSFGSAVVIMTTIHKIMANTSNFWSYILLAALVIYDIALFSRWHYIFAKLNKLFLNWK